MGVENIMYFGLGLLVAGLIALAIMPAIWRRAVRLTKKRIEAAEKYAPEFGISTECGLGRRDPATLPELLRIHAEVADLKPA